MMSVDFVDFALVLTQEMAGKLIESQQTTEALQYLRSSLTLAHQRATVSTREGEREREWERGRWWGLERARARARECVS